MATKNSASFIARFLILVVLMLAADKIFAADPPLPPLVYIVATDPGAAEPGTDTATLTVIRLGPTNASLTVDYWIEGTAQNGVDYATLSGSVTIPAGAHTADIVVAPVDDTLVEGNETVVIALEQPFIWPPPYIVIWPGFAFANIEDNDPAPTNHPPGVALVNPPDGSVFIAPADITLVARASDRDGRVHHVEFFEGTNSLGIVTNQFRPLARAIPLAITGDDASLEITPDDFPDFSLDATRPDPAILPGNLFRLLWEDVPPGHYVLTAVATDNQGAQTTSEPVNIRVTEPPPEPVVNVIAVDPVAAEGPSPGDPADVINTATFVVRRSGNTNIPLTVYYRLSGTASNGVDYEMLPHSVTIPAGERGARVVVVPIDDNLVEGRESVVLTIVPPICIAIFPPPPDCYSVGRCDSARAVILDNDPPATNRPPFVEIVRPLDGSVFLAPADIAIVAQARDSDGRVVTVEFFEGTNSLGVVTNHPSSTTSNRPPFMLVWSNVPPGHYVLSAEATDDGGATSISRPVEIKVVERTIPPTVNIVATDPEASETGGLNNANSPTSAVNTATFRVSRTGPTIRPLLVHYSLGGTASNGLDYRKLTGDLTIPMGAASANIMIHPIDDLLVEGTETVIASLDRAPCLASDSALPDCYIVGTNSRALAIILDNDVNPTNRPPKVAIVEPDDGDVFIAPADIKLIADARDSDGFVRTVEFFANGRSIGVVSNRNDTLGGIDNNTTSTDTFFHMIWSNVLAGDYILIAKATDNRGATSSSEPVRIKVVYPNPPIVTIIASDPYASEGDVRVDPAGDPSIGPIPIIDTATFTVRRSGGTNDPLVVYYTLNGSAVNGVDYRRLTNQITILRGAWTADIVVVPISDNLVEGTETVVATLDPIACPAIFPPPPGCYSVGDPHRAVAYIRDNDFNQPPKVEIVSPRDGAIFPALSDIEIDVLALDPDGYVTKVEFFAGTNRIGVDERIFILPPPPGLEQKFSIIWSNVPAGEYRLTAKATDDRGAMTISEGVKIIVVPATPLPIVTIEAVDKTATEQSPLIDALPDTALFLVKRTGETNHPLVVYYSISGTASNGVDYQEPPGKVEIPAGSSFVRIFIVPIDDNIVEPTEAVILALEKPDCSPVEPTALSTCYAVGDPGRDIAYIRDNDSYPPRIAITSPANGDTFSAPANIHIVARALDPDGWVTQVEFFANGNSIGVVTVNFIIEPPPGQLQIFELPWNNVTAGQYVLTAVATDNSGETARSEPVKITVVNPPSIPTVIIVTPDPYAREGNPTNTATFRIRRDCCTNSPLTVWYSITGTASNGVDYASIGNSVTIPAGRRSAPIVITPVDDRRPEPIETIVLQLQQPPTGSPILSYHIGQPEAAAAIIVDNDQPAPASQRLIDGLVHLCMPAASGSCYRIEASTDLANWDVICRNTVVGDALHFVEPRSMEMSRRFYRVVPDICEDEE